MNTPSQKTENGEISGIVQITRRGVGYLKQPVVDGVTPGALERKSDIEIPPEELAGALNGDEVLVVQTGATPRPRGKVVRVVTRAKERFVSTISKKDGTWIATPADLRFYRPIRITGDTSTLAEGSKALVHLIAFTGTEDPTGEVVQIIGTAGEHRTEMNAIVIDHGFSTEFPAAVLAEAKQVEAEHATTIAKEVPMREDFRDVPTFTIDPLDAKDYDDALSVRTRPDGTYEIGVHIADATFFVRPGTALDDEAVKRGTSVYLVDATIPMLPHELSGNVCSLKQDEDRLAFSAIFTINKEGRVLDRRFAKTVIRSNRRFTYEEAQKNLDTQEGEWLAELNILRDLARILRAERERQGAIDFGDNEVKFILDEKGVPIRVVRKQRIETNLLIEEFMLLANREVAYFVSKLAEKVPEKNAVFLYRIHDQPKEDRIAELATFVRAIGYEFGSEKKKKYTARDIANLLSQIAGKPEEQMIRIATLRSMAKAVYSVKNIGHFGLAFEYYTHFTSPIRRYPDMLVHRILASHLSGSPITRSEYTTLERMCLTASEQEAEAAQAERESVRYKQVEYMQSRIGQTFDATVSGVTEWGMYVEEKETAADGLVRLAALKGDFYVVSPKDYSIVGQRTKKKYALGDAVRVKLVTADLAARTLDFELA